MHNGILLTAVIPVTKMAGKLDNFKSTITQCKNLGIAIVVVHDKRDSETGLELVELLKDYGPSDSVYLEGEFGSAAKARNEGLEVSQSKWICFWDSDDTVYADKFLEMIRIGDMSGSEVAIGRISLTSPNANHPEVESPKINNNKSIDLQISNFPAFTRMGFRKSVLKGNLFPEIPIGEDLIFLLRVNVTTKKISIFNSVVYRYHVGQASQATRTHVGADAYLILLTVMKETLEIKKREELRLNLAFLDKLLLSLIKRTLTGKVSRQGVKAIIQASLYNIASPINAARIFIFFFTHRPKVIQVLHGQ